MLRGRPLRRSWCYLQAMKPMTEDGAGSVPQEARRPYVRPYIRDLDVGDTEGKLNVYDTEYVSDYGQSYAYS